MNAAKERAEDVFCAALEISEPGQRVAFLDKCCMGNAGLRAAVDEMLAAQKDADEFFGSSAPLALGVAPLAAGLVDVSE